MAYIPTYNTERRRKLFDAEQERLDKTFETLQKGHEAATLANSQLKQAVAELDLNSEEDEFKQQLIADIDNTTAENTIYGNSYQALDKLVKLKGDILSNPELLGRLRSQQQYKEFQDKIDKAAIPENFKDYYRNANPYTHQDRYDNNGQVIGSYDWKPIDTFVEHKPISNEFVKEIGKYLNPQKSNETILQWLNPETNEVSDIPQGKTPVLFNTITRTWEKVTDKQIEDAFFAALNANPELKASLDQEYKISKYNIVNGITPLGNRVVEAFTPAGELRSKEDYYLAKLADFQKSFPYNYVKEEVKPNASGLNSLYKHSGGGSGTGDGTDILNSGYASPKAPVGTKTVTNSRSIRQRFDALQEENVFKDWCQKYLANTVDYNIDWASIDNIDYLKSLFDDNYRKINGAIITKEDQDKYDREWSYAKSGIEDYFKRTAAGRLINDYNDEQVGTDLAQVSNLANDLEYGIWNPDRYSLTDAGKEFSQSVYDTHNNIWQGQKYAGYEVDDEKSLNKIKYALGDNWDAFKLNVTKINGRNVIVIPRESQPSLYPILIAIAPYHTEYLNEPDVYGQTVSSGIISSSNIRTGIGALNLDENGNFSWYGTTYNPVSLQKGLTNKIMKAKDNVTNNLRDMPAEDLVVKYDTGFNYRNQYAKEMEAETGEAKYKNMQTAQIKLANDAIHPGTFTETVKRGELDLAIKTPNGIKFITLNPYDEKHMELVNMAADYVTNVKQSEKMLNLGRYWIPGEDEHPVSMAVRISTNKDNIKKITDIEGLNLLDTDVQAIDFVFRGGYYDRYINEENGSWNTRTKIARERLTMKNFTTAETFDFGDTTYGLLNVGNGEYVLKSDMQKGSGYPTGIHIDQRTFDILTKYIGMVNTNPAYLKDVDKSVFENLYSDMQDILGELDMPLEEFLNKVFN